MPLKFISPDEPVVVDAIVSLIYAIPSAGKTTLALGARNPYLLNFEGTKGYARAKGSAPRVDVSSWAEVAAIKPGDFPAGPGTIIVDTIGEGMLSLSNQLIHQNRKNGTQNGGLSLQGYGALKSTFVTWVKGLVNTGKDVVLLAHAVEARQVDDTIVMRPDVIGRGANQIYKFVDVMGYLAIEGDDRRILTCAPTPVSYGKNPAGWGALRVPRNPGDFLARQIQAAKEAMSRNSISAATKHAEVDDPEPGPAGDVMDDEPHPFGDNDTGHPFGADAEEDKLGALNSRLADMLADSNTTNEDKTAIWREAQELGFRYNHTTKEFQD